jgi:tRNA(Ile2) C34 agmatinyltransferase TiaS
MKKFHKIHMAARLPPEDIELLDELAKMGAARDRSDALRRIIAAYKLATAVMTAGALGLSPICPKCGGKLVAVVGTDKLECVVCGARYRLDPEAMDNEGRQDPGE